METATNIATFSISQMLTAYNENHSKYCVTFFIVKLHERDSPSEMLFCEPVRLKTRPKEMRKGKIYLML